MEKTTLRGFKVTKTEFINNIKEQKKIELGFGYSYNVKYSTKNTCVGEFTANITDKGNPDEFRISVTATGMFSFQEGAVKEKLHIETYDDLFPYIRAFVTTLTSNAGIPPIIIPYIDISNKEIYRFELGENGQNPNQVN